MSPGKFFNYGLKQIISAGLEQVLSNTKQLSTNNSFVSPGLQPVGAKSFHSFKIRENLSITRCDKLLFSISGQFTFTRPIIIPPLFEEIKKVHNNRKCTQPFRKISCKENHCLNNSFLKTKEHYTLHKCLIWLIIVYFLL